MTATREDVLVRPIRPEEYDALGEFTVAAYHSLPVMPQQEFYDAQLRDVERRVGLSCVLVATTAAGVLLGGVAYVSGPNDPYSEALTAGEAGMRMLAVDPARHGRGVGQALTQACLDRARAASRRCLVLHTGEWMPAARHLYESMAFRREPTLDFAPVSGVDLAAYFFDLAAGICGMSEPRRAFGAVPSCTWV